MLKPVSRSQLDSYTKFLAKWMLLFIGLPLAVGFVLTPFSILILIVGLDFIWHKMEDMDFP
tara:strand:+ start:57 stop:239 length:183 start_codon:yes stop_codon:yes gene_type:complete